MILKVYDVRLWQTSNWACSCSKQDTTTAEVKIKMAHKNNFQA